MPSSSRAGLALVLLGCCLHAAPARAQAQGFSVERFSPAPAGAGWLAMDALDMHGGLGGAAALTLGYAHEPLRVGSHRLAVVTDQAFADFGFALTWRRFRLSFDSAVPALIAGRSGAVGDTSFVAPSVNPASHPDTLSDYRLGFEARLFGAHDAPFRLGAGAQLIIPSGRTADYDTDGTVRAMGRVLVAGDLGFFTWAGHLGVHVRPRDDAPAPGPRGSELLFGVAAGVRFTAGPAWALVLGPEVYGQTAFRDFFGASTGLEALMTARLEGTGDGPQLRVRLGVGEGLAPGLGVPQWRMVLGVELFGRSTLAARP